MLTGPARGSRQAARRCAGQSSKGTDADEGFLLTRFFRNLLGEQGVESVFGIIYPPQVAIVGFGRIVERPWSVDGSLVSRQVITATLSADHRVTDGHRGSRFLTAVDRLLQEPARL